MISLLKFEKSVLTGEQNESMYQIRKCRTVK